jgi:hypothetical protein
MRSQLVQEPISPPRPPPVLPPDGDSRLSNGAARRLGWRRWVDHGRGEEDHRGGGVCKTCMVKCKTFGRIASLHATMK